VLGIKFCGGRQFSASKSPTSCSCKTLVAITGRYERFRMTNYKYQTIDKYFWKNLIKKQLWFSSPKNFDDDFDSLLPVDTNMPKGEIESFLRLSWQLNFKTQVGFEVALGRAVAALASNHDMRRNFFYSLIDNHVDENIAITCFSNDLKNRTLWGKYADKGTGVCFGFEPSFDKEYFKNLENVNYTETLPKVRMDINTFDERIKEFVTTKYVQWSNQGETRLFRTKVGAYIFNPVSLTRIIFGTRISKQHKEKIISIGLLTNSEIEFFQLEKDRENGEYKVTTI